MQSETETNEILTAPDPDSIPTYAFVLAKINDDGKVEIRRSTPFQQPLATAQNQKHVVETVTQTFTVMVPHTELVDGKKVTKLVPEQRTRNVQVTRVIPNKPNAKEIEAAKKAMENGEEPKQTIEMVSVPYTVNVPYQEIVDGKPVTRMRQERRTRTVSVVRGKTTTKAQISTDVYPLKEVQCFGVDGQPMDIAEVTKRLQENTPIILIKKQDAITPYFENLLHPRAIFMIRP